MEKKSFSLLSVSRLQNDDASGLFQFTLDVARPVKDNIGDIGKLALANFETKATPFIEQINLLRESPITASINVARILNNNLMSEIKRTLVFEKKSRTEERKSAAIELDFFYKPYWDLSKRALQTQIKDTNEMIGKFEADWNIMAKATIIGLNTPMEELKVNNTKLTTLYLDRNQEMGGRASSGTDLRPAAMEGYSQFCTVIEQLVNLLPNDTNISLFNNIDTLRIKAHALLSKSKDKPDETPETK